MVKKKNLKTAIFLTGAAARISQEVAIKILANIQNFHFFENNDLIFTQSRGQDSQRQVVELLEKAKKLPA